jgi:DNA-binding IclR family transcriptional regulator
MANAASTLITGHKPGDAYVQSFARGLEVIRSFSTEAPRQTLTEVAGRSGLSRAGARRILLTLETLGYVHNDGKLFSLTPRILDLGFAYLSSMPIWNLAEPVMEALVAEVKESCSAAALDGTDIVYVLRVPTHKIMSISLGVGSRLPAYCTSMGRMLLSALPEAEAHEVPAGLSADGTHQVHRDRRERADGQGRAGAQAGLVAGESGTGRRDGVDGGADYQPRRPDGGGPQHQRPGQPHQRQGDAGEHAAATIGSGASRDLSVQRN